MIQTNLEISIPAKDKSEVISLEINPEEALILEKWLANCDRFENAAVLESGFPVLRNLKLSADDGLSFEATNFKLTHIPEFLHLGRPIFLAREPASFEKVLAIFGPKAKGTLLAHYLKKLRRVYKDGHYKPYFQLKVGGTQLFDESFLKVWLNGVEYHQDPEKEAIVSNLRKTFSEKELSALFIVQFSGRVEACFDLRDFVKGVFKHAANNAFNTDASKAGSG